VKLQERRVFPEFIWKDYLIGSRRKDWWEVFVEGKGVIISSMLLKKLLWRKFLELQGKTSPLLIA